MPNNRRQSRVAERIREEASGIILQELKDPRMGFVTVTAAEVTPDLQHARIYVSVLGEDADAHKTMKALNHAKGYVQRQIAQRIRLRRAPEITFHIDESAKKTVRILDLIRQIQEEGSEKDAAPREEDGTTGPEPSSQEE